MKLVKRAARRIRLARFRRARRRYKRNPTSENAVRFLRAKARMGWWDDRYCAYWGVSTNVTRWARRFIMRGYALGLVPTSTLRFPVGGGSYHQARDGKGRGKAVDMGLRGPEVGTRRGMWRMRRFQKDEYRKRGKRRHTELIGPRNRMQILRGVPSPLPEGHPLENQHDDHVHGAKA